MNEKLTPREEKVATYLREACYGQANAQKSAELEQVFHMSANDLRNVVNRLRRKSVPIASGQTGYFYAANASEIYTTLLNLQGMIKGLEAAVYGLVQSFDDFGGESL